MECNQLNDFRCKIMSMSSAIVGHIKVQALSIKNTGEWANSATRKQQKMIYVCFSLYVTAACWNSD